MQRGQTVQRLVGSGVIAVVRTSSPVRALELVDAIRAGGVECVEVTMTVPGALHVLEQLQERYGDRILLGAGTVLDPETARLAVLSGARYVISPALNQEVIHTCLRYGVAAVPGCQTVTEALTALEAGADLIKIFPASVLGPSWLRAVRSALPQLPCVPTGGVGPDNAAEWIRAGAVAVGVGGELTGAGSAEAVTAVARRLLAAVQAARQATAG